MHRASCRFMPLCGITETLSDVESVRVVHDLDESPVDIKKWTELEGVRTYFEFFDKHKDDFN